MQNKLNVSSRKEIVKIRVDKNKIQSKKQYKQSMESGAGFLRT